MKKFEIFFNRRTSKVIKAHDYIVQENTILFIDSDGDILFVVSAYNFDYVKVLK